jgi:sugar/nucleoside kinase (ribokinase family)
VVDALSLLGVVVFPIYTPHSTVLRLYYPTSNVDERIISVTETAGSYTIDQIKDLDARAFLINASIRGEVDLEVMRELRRKDTLLAADVQGFVRVIASDGTLKYEAWPEKQQILSQIDILKADAVEAEMLTGIAETKTAARTLAAWGPKEIVLTHRDGVLVFAGGQFHEAPFRPRKLVGRSGRGDTCIASYVAKRLSASPEMATIWAAAVTSLKMEAEGPIKRYMADVEDLIQREYGA